MAEREEPKIAVVPGERPDPAITVVSPKHESHFESLEKQAHAAKVGMWVFLASEVLLFGALFSLYASYRVHYPHTFAEAMKHQTRFIGSINTLILLTSSGTMAAAVHAIRGRNRRLASALAFATVFLGASFLALKMTEYGIHVSEGLVPSQNGRFYREHPEDPYLPVFWTLYWIMTGLHAIHVTIGGSVVAVVGARTALGHYDPPNDHPLHVAALYWHLVDIVWIFLWPCFYLMGKQ